MQDNGYEEIPRRQFLPDLDFELLASYIQSSAKPKDILFEWKTKISIL